jgi:hypothetical protein
MSLLDVIAGTSPPAKDYIVLGGVRSPGRATVLGAGSPRKWDKQQGYGVSGATLAFTGDDLSEFDVVIDLWEDSHWREWGAFAKVLASRPKGRFSPEGAFTIVHPVLNRTPISISSVVVLDAGGFEQNDTGLWTTRIKFSAYRKPRVALGKPNAAIPGVAGKTATAQDAADRQIAALLDEQASLGGAL